MPRVLTRSPIKMPGTRQCRLARRLAAGLSPAEIRRLDTATEEDIEAFVSDRDLSRLVDQYAAVRALPLPERQARLFETAWLELSSLIDVGDRRAMLFVVYQANRARHPVRHLVKLVVERFESVRQPYERRDTPSPAGSSPETMQGYGQHPLGPAQEAINRLVDFLPAQAGEAVLVSAELEPAAAEAPVEEPVATTEEIPPGDAGDPASAEFFVTARRHGPGQSRAGGLDHRAHREAPDRAGRAARARRPETDRRPKAPRPLTEKRQKTAFLTHDALPGRRVGAGVGVSGPVGCGRVAGASERGSLMSQSYPRDMVGYGRNPPNPGWPGGARLALQMVINYEEGGENTILNGDPGSEAFLSEIIGAQPLMGVRNMNMESIYEYGSRAGFWRLWRLFRRFDMPITVYAVGMALERNPDAAAAMNEAGWEIATHGLRWIDYQYMGIEAERHHLEETIRIHKAVTGERPLGFYIGRNSPNSLKLCAEEGGFLYCADSYADDLPYWVTVEGKRQLIVPYTLDANDMRFATAQGFNSADQFFAYLRDSFDVLYAEGEEAPKMMSVGLHCRLTGRPGRLKGLERFLEHVRKHDKVWITRRVDIARHWHAHHG